MKALCSSNSGNLWRLRCGGWVLQFGHAPRLRLGGGGAWQCGRHDGAVSRATGKLWVPAYPQPLRSADGIGAAFAGLVEHLSAA